MILLIDNARESLISDIIARTGEAGLLILGALEGHITELYIDFDLGCNSAINGAQVIVDAIQNEIELPRKIIVASSLPQGKKLLRELLTLHGYNEVKENVFEKEA